MRVVFAAAAERDLDAIGEYIAADSPRRARAFVRELVASARAIADLPRDIPSSSGTPTWASGERSIGRT